MPHVQLCTASRIIITIKRKYFKKIYIKYCFSLTNKTYSSLEALERFL